MNGTLVDELIHLSLILLHTGAFDFKYHIDQSITFVDTSKPAHFYYYYG